MVISKIMLKDFKTYEDTVEISFSGRFNVIIGENNIGKSTIFEALLLWAKCYDESLTSNKKNFYSQSVPLYISFDELYFLRITKDEDLFYGNKRTCEIGVEFSEENSDEKFYLTFSLTKPSIENAYVRVQRIAPEEFEAFKGKMDSVGTKLTDFLFIQQTEPVAKVLAKEPYMFPGQIRKKIEKGRSHEVLRNKILSSDVDTLTQRMRRVLDCDFEFKVPPRTAREKEEYINLYVIQNEKKIDIGLQGSGFLQVAEIFSSMAIMDNALNVLLIDEPDSHISPRIQNKLLSCLKEISNVQVFVITHNDNFVSELDSNDIIFINSENKNNGHIEALNDVNIDVLHSALGGVITGLTRLQKNKRIIFMEGDDDIAYLKAMNAGLKKANSSSAIDFSKISFWYVRGRDNMNLKIMANKQLLSQAVQGCKYAAIFDKDYSTEEANAQFISTVIIKRLGSSSWAHTHNGYCIESVLFSEMSKLKRFLGKITEKDDETINAFVDAYFNDLRQSLSNINSDLYLNMKEKFKSQKKPTRPELDKVEFDIYAREASQKIQYAMNKDNIRAFVLKIEDEWGITLFQREDDISETIASGLLNKYIETIEEIDDIYDDYICLFEKIKKFIVE